MFIGDWLTPDKAAILATIATLREQVKATEAAMPMMTRAQQDAGRRFRALAIHVPLTDAEQRPDYDPEAPASEAIE